MLDEMAANNPEVRKKQEYSKFINKNLQTGIEEAKKDSGKQKVSSVFSFCIKTYTENKKEIVLINVCHSEKVLKPLKNDKSIADIHDLDSWSTIPVSFSIKKEKKAHGKKPMRYYDALVHSGVGVLGC